MSLILCFCCVMSTASTFAATKEGSGNEWHTATVLSETENEDGTLEVTIRDEDGIKTLHFYPVKTTAGTKTRSSSGLNWTGWGSPSTVYYDATAEQEIISLGIDGIILLLTNNLSLAKSAAALVASHLLNAALTGQRTIWLGRTIWIKNDYSAYRRQDTYYSDSHYDRVMYQKSIKEYFGGN